MSRSAAAADVKGEVGEGMEVDVDEGDGVVSGAIVAAPPPPEPPEEDWRQGKTIMEAMEYCYHNDQGTRKDVTFLVGDNEEPISAHRFFLALVSRPLDYILYDDPAISIDVNGHMRIIIRGADPHAFRLMLKFIYCRRNEAEQLEELLELLKLSTRFEIQDLTGQCCAKVGALLDAENVPTILAEAVNLGLLELQELALQRFNWNGASLLESEEFLGLDFQSFSSILQSDYLNVCELTVYQAAVRWAEARIRARLGNGATVDKPPIAESEIRTELGDALYFIRFPLFDAQTFTLHCAKTGILDMEEVFNLYLYLTRSNEGTPPDPSPFNAAPRRYQTHQEEQATASSPADAKRKIKTETGGEPPQKKIKTRKRDQDEDISTSSGSDIHPVQRSDTDSDHGAEIEAPGIRIVKVEPITEDTELVAPQETSAPVTSPIEEPKNETETEAAATPLPTVPIEATAVTPPPLLAPQNPENVTASTLVFGQVAAADTDTPISPGSGNVETSNAIILHNPQSVMDVTPIAIAGPSHGRSTPRRPRMRKEKPGVRQILELIQRDREEEVRKRSSSPKSPLVADVPLDEPLGDDGGGDEMDQEEVTVVGTCQAAASGSSSGRSPHKRNQVLLHEQQEQYIRKNMIGDNANNLENLYNFLSMALEDSASQVMNTSVIRDNAEPVVINASSFPPLEMSHLEEFRISYLHPSESVKKFREYLANLHLQTSLLFFKRSGESTDEENLASLWINCINVLLEVNGITILKIDHGEDVLVLSRIKDADVILGGVTYEPVEHIHLEDVLIESLTRIPTEALKTFTFRKVRVNGPKNKAKTDWEKFLSECRKMEAFSCDNFGKGTINFRPDIHLVPPLLKKLAVKKAHLHCSQIVESNLVYSSLQELYLKNCTWSMEFVDYISFLFPNLKRFQVTEATNLKLILNVLEIPTLVWIAVSNLKFERRDINSKSPKKSAPLPYDYVQDKNKMKEILTEAGLGEDKTWLEEEDKVFIMEKDQQDKWKGRRIPDTKEKEMLDQLDFKNFGYQPWYTDEHLYMKMNDI